LSLQNLDLNKVAKDGKGQTAGQEKKSSGKCCMIDCQKKGRMGQRKVTRGRRHSGGVYESLTKDCRLPVQKEQFFRNSIRDKERGRTGNQLRKGHTNTEVRGVHTIMRNWDKICTVGPWMFQVYERNWGNVPKRKGQKRFNHATN